MSRFRRCERVFTRKAAGLLTATIVLAGLALMLQAYAAAVAAGALWLLFSVNAFAILPPELEVDLDPGSTEVVEGQLVEVDIHAENRGSRSLFFQQRLALPSVFESGADQGGYVNFEAEEARRWTVAFRPQLLGGYEIGPLEARVVDPSGFRVFTRTIGDSRHLLVRPRREDIKTAPVELGETVRFFGIHEATQPGEGFEFYTLRPWEQGDTIRMVNWRATARSDEIIVNQRARESFVSVAVFLDRTASTFRGRLVTSPYAQCARAVATLVDHLLDNRDEVSVHILSDGVETIHPQAAQRQLRTVLRSMATGRPSGRQRWDETVEDVLPSLKPSQPVVLASPFETDPTVLPAIRDLAARDHQIIALSAPTDWPAEMADTEQARARRKNRELARQEIRRGDGLFVEVGEDRPLGEAFLEAVMG